MNIFATLFVLGLSSSSLIFSVADLSFISQTDQNDEEKTSLATTITRQATAATASTGGASTSAVNILMTAGMYDPLTDSLFIGTTGQNLGTCAVVQFVQNNTVGPLAIPLAKEAPNLNACGSSVTLQKSPVYNSPIAALTLTGKNTTSAVVSLATGPTDLYLLEGLGSNVITTVYASGTPINDQGLFDAMGVGGTGVPVALAANRKDGNDQVFFVAMPDNTAGVTPAWGTPLGRPDATGRGIAVVKRTNNALSQTVQAASIVSGTPAAVSLSLKSMKDDNASGSAFKATGVAFYDQALSAGDVIGAARIGNTASMIWDESFSTLYLGLTDVEIGKDYSGLDHAATPATGATGLNGGVVSVMAGYYTGAQLTLRPLVASPSVKNFGVIGSSVTGSVIGYYAGALGSPLTTGPAPRAQVTAKKMCVMHTSTGFDYLIINGGVRTTNFVGDPGFNRMLDATNAAVYALPLVGKKSTTARPGLLAANDTAAQTAGYFVNPASDAAHFYTFDMTHASTEYDSLNATSFSGASTGVLGEGPGVVGCDPRFLQDPTNYLPANNSLSLCTIINDMQVVGDAVFVSTDKGIFYSAAIFNQYGIIYAWTAWQRVGGVLNNAGTGYASAVNFGVSPTTGSVMYIAPVGYGVTQTATGSLNNVNTVRTSLWGTSASVQKKPDGTSGTSRGLTELVNQYFPAARGGVTASYVIDPFTPGLAVVGTGGVGQATYATAKTSLLVLLGYDTVAIAVTSFNGVPIATYSKDTNFFVYQNDALRSIAPLTSFTVLHSTAANQGHFYVGGLGGLCYTNSCWDSSAGLSNLVALASATFTASAQNALCKNVIKVFGMINHIFAVTTTGTVRFADNDLTLVNPPTITTSTKGFARDALCLYTSSPNFANAASIVAYQKSLVFTTVGGATTEVSLPGNFEPLAMSYVSFRRGFNSVRGNLYVLVGDATQGVSKVIRYFVQIINASTPPIVTQIAPGGNIANDQVQQNLNFGVYRDGFSTDGFSFFNNKAYTAQANSPLINMRMSDDKAASEFALDQLLGISNGWYGMQVNSPLLTTDGTRLVTSASGTFVNE